MTAASVLYDAPGPRTRARHRWYSAVGLALILGLFAWVLITLALPRENANGQLISGVFHPSRWAPFADPEVWRALGRGAMNTLRAAGVAMGFALVLGTVLSFARLSRRAWVRLPVAALLEFFRGMPVLLMMLFILLLASTGAFWAVVLALSVYNAAIIGEALRSGILALNRGQREAGLAIGLSPGRTRLLIEFPQAFRQMLPILIAQLVVLLKDTSLGYIVAYNELSRTVQQLSQFTGSTTLFSFWVVAVALYLAINLSVSWLGRRAARARAVVAIPVERRAVAGTP